MTKVFSPLELPNGQILPNRLGKAAMEENLANHGQVPGEALANLYGRWARGGAGLILTGNVMVSPDAMTGTGGVFLGKNTLFEGDNRMRFTRWANAGKSGDGKFYMQISHPGRQVFASFGTVPVSASATRVKMAGASEKMFTTARALTGEEVRGMIQRFADTAAAAEEAGFDGVQIHAAHGYLIAQFLSPLTNLRDDEWGGTLENRARLLMEIVRAVRARVAPDFGVSIKLNSADFQSGGFEISDAKQIVEWLNAEPIDFVELSGGSYESTAMMGASEDDRLDHVGTTSTAVREMYFLEFAKKIAAVARMPLMVTGGVTQCATAEAALEADGIDIIGIATAISQTPDLPNDWKAGKSLKIDLPVAKWKNKRFKSLARTMITKTQLVRMGAAREPKKLNPFLAIIGQLRMQAKQTKRYKKWLMTQLPTG